MRGVLAAWRPLCHGLVAGLVRPSRRARLAPTARYITLQKNMGWRDEWPIGPDGEKYDGKQLMELVRNNASPFKDVWDVQLLIKEIEEKLQVKVTDIPIIDKGSNNYGFHFKVQDGPDMVVRLARGDVNMPGFDGFAVEQQISEVTFEAATYNLLRDEAKVRPSRLLYSRAPVLKPGPKTQIPNDLSGRRIFVFERSDGTNNVWEELDAEEKALLLEQLARVRAALFNYCPPSEFAAKYLHSRIFDFKPHAFTFPVEPTREFWVHVMKSKIEATIKNEGDMIGWEDDEETVGPVALAAKQSLLRAIPHLLPMENSEVLYRLVLEHGDFGIHNTSITKDNDNKPRVTSLYDWETACIVPALLADPLVAAGPVDLITNGRAEPAVTRIPGSPTATELEAYAAWSRHYIMELYKHAPDLEVAIKAGQDVRYLWFALRDWHGGGSERFFGDLGTWAEARLKDMGVS